jgi:hypothetical protein
MLLFDSRVNLTYARSPDKLISIFSEDRERSSNANRSLLIYLAMVSLNRTSNHEVFIV